MNTIFKTVLTAIIVSAAIMLAFSANTAVVMTKEGASSFGEAPVCIKCLYYAEDDFRNSVMDAVQSKLPAGGVKGGIVPHHLLAGNIIASFFDTLAQQKPELVIMIGPNHNGVGLKSINTGKRGWETAFGIQKPDTGFVDSLLKNKTVAENYVPLEQDHSISGLIPYVKYYMPDAQIVPILLHGNLSLEESVWLGKELVRIASGKSFVIVASIDFSHYLPGSEADDKDEATLSAIKSRNLKGIRSMGNDNLDSPPSLICFLSAMQEAGAENELLLAHSNSEKITRVESNSTTSYFSMLFY